MKVQLEKEIERAEIGRFTASHRRATFFHTPAWMEALAEAYPRFEPQWLTARDGGELRGFMPLVESRRGPFTSLWALPFGTYGDPVADDGAVSRTLIQEFFELARRRGVVEAETHLFLAGSADGLPAFDTGIAEYLSSSVRVQVAESRTIDLEGGFEGYWDNNMTSKRRQICRKGEREGVTVRPLEGEVELESFYALYEEESAAWGGVHPYPLSLFRELFKRSDEGVVIWGGFVEGELLGGHVNFYFGQMAQAWQAGMSARSREYGIDVMLVVKAVEEACRRGMKIYNLGSSGGNEGIMFFKQSLGGREYRYPVVAVRKRWWRWLKRG